MLLVAVLSRLLVSQCPNASPASSLRLLTTDDDTSISQYILASFQMNQVTTAVANEHSKLAGYLKGDLIAYVITCQADFSLICRECRDVWKQLREKWRECDEACRICAGSLDVAFQLSCANTVSVLSKITEEIQAAKTGYGVDINKPIQQLLVDENTDEKHPYLNQRHICKDPWLESQQYFALENQLHEANEALQVMIIITIY